MAQRQVLHTLLKRISRACDLTVQRENIARKPMININVDTSDAILEEIYKGIRFLEYPHLSYLACAGSRVPVNPNLKKNTRNHCTSEWKGYRYAPGSSKVN